MRVRTIMNDSQIRSPSSRNLGVLSAARAPQLELLLLVAAAPKY
jgi:hypothetical protein